LDADIEGCFDNIDHEYLLNKLNTMPIFKEQIRSWLRAGIMDTTKKEDSEYNIAGTPQGGVISPLLSNIALHGMETEVLSKFGRDRVKLIRYADDFVVMGKKYDDIIKAEGIVKDFLKPIGLNLSESKSRIGHTMENKPGMSGIVGLDFLGYHFRNYPRSKHRGVKSTRGVTQNFIQVSKPSLSSVKRHKGEIRKILRANKSSPLEAVIAALSARIRGWTEYYAITKCTRYFSFLDAWLWKTL
jgi:RNA-directed DNA polymerase